MLLMKSQNDFNNLGKSFLAIETIERRISVEVTSKLKICQGVLTKIKDTNIVKWTEILLKFTPFILQTLSQ